MTVMSIQLMNPLRACWARGFGRGGDMSSILQKTRTSPQTLRPTPNVHARSPFSSTTRTRAQTVQTQPSTAHSPPPPPISTRAATNTSGIQIRPIAGTLGAEISNIDLSSPLSAPDIASIRRALLSHLVIFFRNQPLPPRDFLKFTSHFGQPVEYPFVKGLDGLPEVIRILKREDEKVNFGGVWHSDTSYFDEPPMGSVLLAREVPPYGGDTLFANQYAAYEALSPSLQKTLSTLRGVNTSKKADASKTREDRIKDSGKQVAPQDYEASHPVVRTHPETGRKALYINIAHTARFEGWSEEESQPLLKYLFEWQVRPEFTCRFRWEEGSIAFWDNRCAQHNPINDYHGHRRLMHRITLGGDVPV